MTKLGLTVKNYSASLAQAVWYDLAVKQDFGCRYSLHHMTTLDAVSLFPNNSIDVLYVDALHTYEGVNADIVAWHPKLRKGGYVVFNDVLPQKMLTERMADPAWRPFTFPGVKKAAEEYVVRENLPPLQQITYQDAYTQIEPMHSATRKCHHFIPPRDDGIFGITKGKDGKTRGKLKGKRRGR
eukprot:Hpha_TRINITY_DN2335_c0_g1::TRINITY_DN2335_c0_g1_i2::g.327::m.327